MRIDFDLDDLTNSALKRLVKQLLTSSDEEEKKIMNKLAKRSKQKNDLADLDEEMHGKPNTPKVEDDSFDLEAHGDGEDDSASDMIPKRKGKK